MSIGKEFADRFSSAGTVEKQNEQGMPKPAGVAFVADIDVFEWGSKAVEVWEGIQDNEVVDLYGLIQLIKQDIKKQADEWASENSGENPLPAGHMTICKNKVVVIRPALPTNSELGGGFAEEATCVAKAICEDIKARPYLSVCFGEVETCCVRNSFQGKIATLPENVRTSVKNQLLKATVDRFDGVGNIPRNHPAIVRCGILLTTFTFTSTNGNAIVVCTAPLRDDPEVDDIACETLCDRERSHQEGRAVVDAEYHELIRSYDKSQFGTRD